jgi:hypothetical protein
LQIRTPASKLSASSQVLWLAQSRTSSAWHAFSLESVVEERIVSLRLFLTEM